MDNLGEVVGAPMGTNPTPRRPSFYQVQSCNTWYRCYLEIKLDPMPSPYPFELRNGKYVDYNEEGLPVLYKIENLNDS